VVAKGIREQTGLQSPHAVPTRAAQPITLILTLAAAAQLQMAEIPRMFDARYVLICATSFHRPAVETKAHRLRVDRRWERRRLRYAGYRSEP